MAILQVELVDHVSTNAKSVSHLCPLQRFVVAPLRPPPSPLNLNLERLLEAFHMFNRDRLLYIERLDAHLEHIGRRHTDIVEEDAIDERLAKTATTQ